MAAPFTRFLVHRPDAAPRPESSKEHIVAACADTDRIGDHADDMLEHDDGASATSGRRPSWRR